MNNKPQTNNLFLLGAGFTKAVWEYVKDDVPANKELLQKVIDSCKPPSNCNRTELNVKGKKILKTTLPKKYSEKYETPDIEVLLTRLDLEILTNQDQNNALMNDRKEIERLLVEYFEQFRLGCSHNLQVLERNTWLEDIALKLFHTNDIIVTLNYDCSLEGLLDHFEIWSPNGGYVEIRNSSQNEYPKNPKNIRIAKIHGSENFRLCSMLKEKNRKYVSFEINGGIYPRSGKNGVSTEGIDPEAYIIAPSFVKTPHGDIERMMIQVLGIAGKAKNFIIIGCGMRPEDTFLRLLVTKFLYQKKADRRLIIVDFEAEKIRAIIDGHYSGGIEGFSVKTILFSNGFEDDYDRLIKCLNNLRKC